MRYIKNTVNFFGVLISLVLSFALVLVLLAIPCMFAAQMTVEPATLQQIVVALTVNEHTQQTADPQEALLQRLLQTQTAQDLMGLYVDDIFHQMGGEASKLSPEDLRQLAEEHMDELLPLFRQLLQQTGVDVSALTDAQLEKQALILTEQYGSQLLRKLPTLEDIGVTPVAEPTADSLLVIDMDIVDRVLNLEFRRADVAPLLTQFLLLLKDNLGLKLLAAAAAALSLLILFFRMGGGFRGLSWLGTDYIISAALCIVLGLYGKFMAWQLSGRSDMPPIFQALPPILNWFLIGGAALLVLGILFGVILAKGGSLLYKHRVKKRAA